MITIFTLLQRRRTKLVGIVVAVCCVIAFAPRGVEAVGVAPAILDLSLHPGEVAQRTVTVINTEDVTRTFQFLKENFSPSNEPGIALFDKGKEDAFPSWIDVSPDSLSLQAMQQASITFTVSVPEGAPSGDYYGVVFVTPNVSSQATARTAILFFLTVLGESHFDADFAQATLRTTLASTQGNALTVQIQNAGNAYVKPTGTIEIDPLVGRKAVVDLNPDALRILVGETRTWSVEWGMPGSSTWMSRLTSEWRAFALGPVRVIATLHVGADTRAVTKTTIQRFWVFPWRTGLLILLMLLCTFVLVRLPRRYQ